MVEDVWLLVAEVVLAKFVEKAIENIKNKIDFDKAQKQKAIISFYKTHRERIAAYSLLYKFLVSISPDSKKFYHNKPFLYEEDWLKQPCPIDDVLDSNLSERLPEKISKDRHYENVLNILRELGTINT